MLTRKERQNESEASRVKYAMDASKKILAQKYQEWEEEYNNILCPFKAAAYWASQEQRQRRAEFITAWSNAKGDFDALMREGEGLRLMDSRGNLTIDPTRRTYFEISKTDQVKTDKIRRGSI